LNENYGENIQQRMIKGKQPQAKQNLITKTFKYCQKYHSRIVSDVDYKQVFRQNGNHAHKMEENKLAD